MKRSDGLVVEMTRDAMRREREMRDVREWNRTERARKEGSATLPARIMPTAVHRVTSTVPPYVSGCNSKPTVLDRPPQGAACVLYSGPLDWGTHSHNRARWHAQGNRGPPPHRPQGDVAAGRRPISVTCSSIGATVGVREEVYEAVSGHRVLRVWIASLCVSEVCVRCVVRRPVAPRSGIPGHMSTSALCS
jgi:hypothetical protein